MLRGDVNGNGKVNIYDAIMLRQYLTCKDDVTVGANADLNGDGAVNVFDIVSLTRLLLK